MTKTKIEFMKNVLAGVGAVALLIISLVVASNPDQAGEQIALALFSGASAPKTTSVPKITSGSGSIVGATGESECGFLEQWKIGEENAGPFSMAMGADKKMYVVSTGAKTISIGANTVFTQYKDIDGKLKPFVSPRDIALTTYNAKNYLLVTDYGSNGQNGKILALTVVGGVLTAEQSWNYINTSDNGFQPTHIVQYGSPEKFFVVNDASGTGNVYRGVIGDKDLIRAVQDGRISKAQGTIAGITVGGSNMYITVTGATNKIHSYNTGTNRYYKSYEKQGPKEGELGIVSDVSFADGKVFVSDIQKNVFVVFSPELDYLFTMEDYYGAHDPNNPNGNGIQFSNVSSLYYGPDGYLYATSYRIENGKKIYYVSRIGLDCVNINIIKTFPNLSKNSDTFKFITGVNFRSPLPQMVPPTFDLPTLGSYKKDLTVRYFSSASGAQGKYFFNEEPIYWTKGPNGTGGFYLDKNGNKIEKYYTYWKCIYDSGQKTVKTTTGTGYRVEVIPFAKDQTIDCYVSNYQKGLKTSTLSIEKDVYRGESDYKFLFHFFNSTLNELFDGWERYDENLTLIDDGGTYINSSGLNWPNNKADIAISDDFEYELRELAEDDTKGIPSPVPKLWHASFLCSYYDELDQLYKTEYSEDLVNDTSSKNYDYYRIGIKSKYKDKVYCKVTNCEAKGSFRVSGINACPPDLKDDATIRVEKHYYSPVLDGGGLGGELTEVPFNFSITEPNKLVSPKDFELKDNGQSGKNIYQVKVPGGLIYDLEEKIDVNKLTKYEDRLPPKKTIVSYSCQIFDKVGTQVGVPKTGKGTKVKVAPPAGGRAECKFFNCPGDPLKKEDVDFCENYISKNATIEITKEYLPDTSPSGLYFKFDLIAQGGNAGSVTLDDDGSNTPYPKTTILNLPGNFSYNIFEKAFQLVGGKELEDKQNIYSFLCTIYKGDGKVLETKTSLNKFVTVKPPIGGKAKCTVYNCAGDPTNPDDVKKCQALVQLTGGGGTSGATGGAGGGQQY